LPAAHGAETIERGGVVAHTYSDGHRLVLTWLRRGHTCVLSGAGVQRDAMLRLAAWRSHGEVPY
jgi:hypothetical protein